MHKTVTPWMRFGQADEIGRIAGVRQRVQHNDAQISVRGQEMAHQIAADKAGPARDQDTVRVVSASVGRGRVGHGDNLRHRDSLAGRRPGRPAKQASGEDCANGESTCRDDCWRAVEPGEDIQPSYIGLFGEKIDEGA